MNRPSRRTSDGPISRQVLNPAATVLWRDEATVQVELGPTRVTVTPVDPAVVGAARRTGAASSIGPEELLSALHAAGLTTSHGDAAGNPPEVPGALAAERRALLGRRGDDADAVMLSRRRCVVAVQGTGRAAVTIASTLAAAGVGTIQLSRGSDMSASDSCPGGLHPLDEGHRFATTAATAVHRAAPAVITDAIPGDRPPDVVVLTDPAPIDDAVRASLHRDGAPHLVATVAGSTARVGPFVLPGITSCLRCADLHRTDRDPAWPRLAVQLVSSAARRPGSEVSLCMAVAGLSAAQVLAVLDARVSDHTTAAVLPASANATLECTLPDWRFRRRTWSPHPACGCGAAARSTLARQNGDVSTR